MTVFLHIRNPNTKPLSGHKSQGIECVMNECHEEGRETSEYVTVGISFQLQKLNVSKSLLNDTSQVASACRMAAKASNLKVIGMKRFLYSNIPGTYKKALSPTTIVTPCSPNPIM